jgi:PAS domain S-box-containing protein
VGDLHPAALPLRERLGNSPLIGWLKDLDGRYQYANGSYLEQLGVSEERLIGRTDAELPAHDVVDGPRAREMQLEYRVPAFEARPELAVMRFAVRSQAGELVGVCGVASRTGDPRLSAECGELLALQGQAPLAVVPVPVAAMPVAHEEPVSPPEDATVAELAAVRRELDAAHARIAELERGWCDDRMVIGR